MAYARLFQRDPIPDWDVLGAIGSPSARLGREPLGAGGCNLLVRFSGLDPDAARDPAFQRTISIATGVAAGMHHIFLCGAPWLKNPTSLHVNLHFRDGAASLAKQQEIADIGTLQVLLPDGTEHTGDAGLLPSSLRADEAKIVLRNVRSEWGRVGVTRLLLRCAGYQTTDVPILREHFGSLPACQAALMPNVGCADTIVAFVRPPPGDKELRQLPRRLVSPHMDVDITIQVKAHVGQLPNPSGPAPPPNPFRQRQREQQKAYRATGRQQGGRGQGMHPTHAATPHPMPSGPNAAPAAGPPPQGAPGRGAAAAEPPPGPHGTAAPAASAAAPGPLRRTAAPRQPAPGPRGATVSAAPPAAPGPLGARDAAAPLPPTAPAGPAAAAAAVVTPGHPGASPGADASPFPTSDGVGPRKAERAREPVRPPAVGASPDTLQGVFRQGGTPVPTAVSQAPFVFNPSVAAAPTELNRMCGDKGGLGRPDTWQAARARARVRWCAAGFPIRVIPIAGTSTGSVRMFDLPVPTAVRQRQAFDPGQTTLKRVGQGKRGSAHADTPRAASAGNGARGAAGSPLRNPRTFRKVARYMDWTPGTPPRSPSPPPAVSHPAPAVAPGVSGNPEDQAPSGQVVQQDGAPSGLAPEPASPAGPAASTAEQDSPTDYMEGVEEAILLPQEWPAAELVGQARSFVEDISFVVTRRQIDQAIHHVITREPSTWQEALGVGDCRSCPHNLQVALRTYMEDVCPDMRQAVDEEELGPDPSQASPSPPSSDRPSSPPDTTATAPASASPGDSAQATRRSTRQRRGSQAWWQHERDPAPEGRGGPS
jgi:hypothetical protein